ncbi:beta-glucosidase [Actinoplanes lutulentus]|uniref:beta-glucosidase n=1 Tax=Actinoplanes lutulentus TaxID=1287878 RepID=A0A327ZLN1_9ACTN|nr:glycoside hydrolase family 3 N-terminal domain-containing protein [Actinoplanes lutulentus]MBB2941240.1 beta-glucosidase [Actinoplanes lutulentus]RAK43549.1 beta-glucosidase [Actinoplanes lutulentus]
MFPYQDAGISVEQRVEDLLSRMALEDKAGLVFQTIASVGDFDAPGIFGSASVRELLGQRLTHFNILFAPSAREIAQWHNALQDEARKHPLGIPVTISSDPRHSFTDNPMTALLAGPFTQFPESLGLAAIGSEELVERFADLTRREYVAVGIRAALHPQIDLATEPRWARQSATFGEDAGLSARLGVAYIRGLQGVTLNAESVSVMAKHFPGGGPQLDGEDPHFAYGREQVYPGGQFDLHLKPFKAAIAAGVSQLMPYYGMPVDLCLGGKNIEQVGFGFNKDIITGLLREKLGYDGIVCTDWGILSNTCWGVEHLSFEERMVKAFDAGIDQFGGEFRADTLVSLVKNGSISEARLDVSVRRLLREKFRLGLFDNPYVDADAAERIVGDHEQGVAAQAAAHTLLTNADDGPARLPLATGIKIYAEGLTDLGGRGELVATPEEADVAILKLQAPFEQRGEANTIESFFRAGSLAFPAAEIERVQRIAATVPTVVDIYLDRPAILAPIAASAASLVANFGASEEAILRVLFGEAEPQGNLPFDIPSSMAAVEASRPDVPFDTADPTFRYGHGLRYTS